MSEVGTGDTGFHFTQPKSASDSRHRRDIVEILVAYALIIAALWTPRPLQFAIDLTALAWVIWATICSFESLTIMGLRGQGFLRSLWVAGVALLLATLAVAVSAHLHALHAPYGLLPFVRRFGLYAVWSLLQEFLLLDFFLLRLVRLLESKTAAVVVTAALFTGAHAPNPVLMPLVLVWAIVSCVVFLHNHNLYALGLAHAILGICVAVTVPSIADHNMRVGLGYLIYHPRPAHQRKSNPHTVSTVACVSAEAPILRSLRQARP